MAIVIAGGIGFAVPPELPWAPWEPWGPISPDCGPIQFNVPSITWIPPTEK